MLQHNRQLSAHSFDRNRLLNLLNMAKKRLFDRYIAGREPVEATFQISRYLIFDHKFSNF